MSLRLRLTLWYAGLTSFTVVAIALLAYIPHARSQYLDVDRALVEEAGYLSPVLDLASDKDALLASLANVDGFQAFVRLYDANGLPLDESSISTARPPLGALETIAADNGPAYDAVLRQLPGGGEVSAPGVFATSRVGGHRVRVYVQPVSSDGVRTGYVQTWTSLAGIDRSLSRFRLFLFGGAVLAAVVVWGGGLAISGLALRPLGSLIGTASSISQSGRFDRRVEAPRRSDELGTLAVLFNEMLDALERSYRAQQRFVADAAHELRAPLTVIRGNIELLDRVATMSEADRREALDHLQQESLRLSRLVDELLILAQSDAGLKLETQPTWLDTVAIRAVAQMDARNGPPRVVEGEMKPALVEGDPDRLHQLVTILVDNALKYSVPADGPVTVSVRRVGSVAELEVRDQGVGIPAEALPQIFRRFYRADPARSPDPGGSGLGLSIGQWIADQHGATIDVESEVGEGTRVTVRFPALGDAASTDGPRAGARSPRSQSVSASEAETSSERSRLTA